MLKIIIYIGNNFYWIPLEGGDRGEMAIDRTSMVHIVGNSHSNIKTNIKAELIRKEIKSCGML